MRNPTNRERPTGAGPRPGPFTRARNAIHRGDSAGWLLCTVLQAVLTWGFIGILKISAGWPWEHQARLLVVVAIVATWCLALRTIHARLVELVRYWHAASKGILKKASDSGLHQIPATLKGWQVRYVQHSIFQLRLIAAGITMPFFILPAFIAAVSVSLCWYRGHSNGGLLGLALLAAVSSAIVGAYFHWSILPAPIEVSARVPRYYPVRVRPRNPQDSP